MWENKSAALLEKKFGDTSFTTKDAYRVLKDHSRVRGGYSLGSIYHLLSVLCKKGILIRLGRGFYKFPSESDASRIRVTDRINISDRVLVEIIPGKLAEATKVLRAKGIEFMVTGPSALAKFHHYVARRLLHLIYVVNGSGESSVEALREHGFNALLNPKYSEIELILSNSPDDDIFIVREFSSLDGNSDGRATIERALVDSYFETTRRRMPFPEDEVARIFAKVVRNEPISLSRLARFSSRRGIAPEIAAIFGAMGFPLRTHLRRFPLLSKRSKEFLSYAKDA